MVEFVFSLAEDEVYYDNELKAILKKAYEKEIPMEILYRKKKGFSIPSNYVAENNETKYMAILRQEWTYWQVSIICKLILVNEVKLI